MPLYTGVCEDCKEKEDYFCPVDERHSQNCHQCGGKLVLQVSTCAVKWNTDCPTASGGKEPS